MNLNFNTKIKSCCTWLFFGLFLLGMSPDAIANTLTIKNEGDCAVNIYHWLPDGDVYQTTLQSGHNFQINSSEGEKYRAVDTDNVWSNLLFDQHYMLNGNSHQTWSINPNYCAGASNGCDGQIIQFQLNKQNGSALINLTDGATFCESDFSGDVKVRALVSGTHESLQFTIIGPNGTQTKKENQLTYDSGQFWLSPGQYTVKAELFRDSDLTGDLCDTEMISFTVNDCTAPVVCEPKDPCDAIRSYKLQDVDPICDDIFGTGVFYRRPSGCYGRHTPWQIDGDLTFIEYADGTAKIEGKIKNGGESGILDICLNNKSYAGATWTAPCYTSGLGTNQYFYNSFKGKVSIDGEDFTIEQKVNRTGFIIANGASNDGSQNLGIAAWMDGTFGGCSEFFANLTPMNPCHITFDCPTLSANIGDACDDGNADTENDVIGSDCVCLGTALPCTGLELPTATVIGMDESSFQAKDGMITFAFDNVGTNRTHYDFSIDGGNTWSPAISENEGTYKYSNLAPGVYNAQIRWGNNQCPNDLGTVTIAAAAGQVYDCPQLEANTGDACNDGNENTENDVVTADCGCEGTQINILLPSILINDIVVNEADGTASLTVGIDLVSATDVVVDFATTDGTANAGVDYAALAGSITIPAGQQSATLTFDILEDTTDETDEIFNVILSNPQGATIVGALGSVTILDNDDPVVPGGCSAAYTIDGNVITITGVTGAIKTVKVLDEGWNAVFSCDSWSAECNETESVTIPSCGTYYVQVQTYADWSTPICNVFETVVINDGCGAGVDCPGLGLNFGASCDDGNANTINDIVMQDCGCYGTPVGPTVDCPVLNANIGDACNDFNPNTDNDVIQANCTCAGSAGPSTCSVTYSVDGKDILVDNISGAIRSVKILDENWGTIFSCDDWTTQCGTSETITVPSCGKYFIQVHTYADWSTTICNLFETVEIVDGCGVVYDCPALEANIGDACNDGFLNTENDVITDDCICAGTEIVPTGNLSINDVTVNEDAGVATLQICLDVASANVVGVTFAPSDGTAVLNEDYVALIGAANIPAGDLCVDVILPIEDDLTPEQTETFDVILSNPQGANIADGVGVVTILDNDVVVPVIPNISIDDVVVNEAEGTASLTIAIDQVIGNDVVVDFGTTDGTAIAGIDYTTLTGTVTIPAGQQFVTVTFDILEDTTDETDEVFNVVLSNPQGAVISGGLGTVTILDNDDPIGPVYDCPALGANIGDACDDGDATTNNDLVQADCSCAGMPMNNTQCEATYSVAGRTITVDNVIGAITAVKIIDNSWNVLYECNDWATPCQETEAFTVPTCGTYFVQVQTYADWNTIVCNLFETVVIDSDCDGGSPDPDCPALDANIGDACDDGNAATENDVVRDDCSCAGTLVVTPPTCDNVTDGGAIEGDEIIEAGTEAGPITSAQLPSGGTGAIEYIWLSATDRCPRFLSDTIPGAYNSTYEPGVLTETTYFVRCSRRAGCAENTDWQFGESNCVVKEVTAGSPNTICAEREALNTRTCHSDVLYGVWLQGEPYTIRDGKFIEYTDGTAILTGHANGLGDINVTFEGRVYHQDSVKFGGCLGETPTDDWYYYSTFSGTLGSHSVTPRGPIFQVGTGANVQQADEFGGAAWFDTHDGLKGDFNLHLTGAPALCQTVSARVSTNSFNANIDNGIVQLDWTNNTGSQNDYFEVERSVDGVSFESIGVYETQGLDDTPTFYSSEDGSPLEGFNFYRLKLTFLDGTFEYSDTRRVKISDIESFGIFPNPARDYVNVSLKGYTGKDINIQLLNQMGQPLKSVQLENVEDNNYSIELDGLNNGIYSIWIFAEGAKPVGKKMIVNKQY